MLKHLVDVVWNNLQACNYQRQFEVRYPLLCLLDHFVDDIYLLGEAHRDAIVIKEHPADVA